LPQTQPPAVAAPAGAPATDAGVAADGGGWSTRDWVTLLFGIGAAGTAAAAVGLELSADGDAGQASTLSGQLPAGTSYCVQTSNPACQSLYDANHSAQDKRNLAVPLFISGAALAAVAVTILVWPRGHSEAKTGLALSASPGSSSMMLRGSF
jgi:hypothetical protein